MLSIHHLVITFRFEQIHHVGDSKFVCFHVHGIRIISLKLEKVVNINHIIKLTDTIRYCQSVATFHVVMTNLNDDQIAEVVSAINIFDTVGDGTLPLARMVDCLRSLGLNPLRSEVNKIARDIRDNDHKMRIDIDEFLPIYEYFIRRRKPTFDELCEGLKSLTSTDAGEYINYFLI